jgi:ADP-ribose pyrophosphatase
VGNNVACCTPLYYYGETMPFDLIESKVVYPGRAFKIRRDQVRLPDGRSTHLDVVEHHGSVVIVPLDDHGNLLFVNQYRHAAACDMLEFPAGTLEDGELPEVCADRELREETGHAAKRLEPLGGFYLAPGYSTEYMHVFLATQLYSSPLESDADEFLQVITFSLEDAFQMAEKGNLLDSKSLAALWLARSRLDNFLKNK